MLLCKVSADVALFYIGGSNNSKPLLHILLSFFFHFTNAANFEVKNQCPFTVWAGAVPGGGACLEQAQSWSFDVSPGTGSVQIWPRTNCNFDGSGKGRCHTGDCGELLQCQVFVTAPNTVAEYVLNQDGNLNFFDISLLDGFNVAMEFIPKSNKCKGVKCNADINGQCPTELRAPEGCNDPCMVFMNNQYCCYWGGCSPTEYSRFFKNRCPDAYTYPLDDPITIFTCPGGMNYTVVFCPWDFTT